MNKTKLSIVFDEVLPKVSVPKKKQVSLDRNLTHFSLFKREKKIRISQR
jgi:hypothetical protein